MATNVLIIIIIIIFIILSLWLNPHISKIIVGIPQNDLMNSN